MLLLWLSIIIMIPFDMRRLDGASDGSVADAKTAPITLRIIELGKVASVDACKLHRLQYLKALVVPAFVLVNRNFCLM